MKKITQVVAAIIANHDGEFLLSSRPAGKPYAGYWEFAGGKVEEGESLLAALQRELWEELNIQIHHAQEFEVKTHEYEHATVQLHFFLVHADDWSGEIRAKEGQQWAWQNPHHYTVAPMLPANEALLAALCHIQAA